MNTVDAINSESAEPDPSESAMRTFSERTPVSLATLKQDGILFDRAEAIAITQALCLALITAQGRRAHNSVGDLASAVPPVTAETVFIDPASRLGVSVDDAGDEATAIQSVGKILAEIVPSNARRSLETKIISKALASPPQFGTVRELSQALARFEQPHGRELIQALYERWTKGEVTKPKSTIRLGSQRKAAAVVAVSVVVIGVNAWFVMSRLNAERSTITTTEDSTVTVAPSPLVEARPIAVVTRGVVTWSVAGAEEPAVAMAPVSVSPAEAAVRTTRPRAIARIDRPAPSPPSPLIGRTSVIGTSDVVQSSNSVASAMSLPSTEPVDHAPARAGAVSNDLASAVTYTAGDLDVSPPVPILPRLIASLQPSSPGVRLDALAVAVVVDEHGKAYSVRGVYAPQNMGEYVLLTSALAVVKSWEFRPALKDGVPVSYRLILPLRELTRAAP